MTRIESLGIAIKYLEDNGFDVENREEVLDILTDMFWEMVKQQSINNRGSSEESDRIDQFNRIITHPEAFINRAFGL